MTMGGGGWVCCTVYDMDLGKKGGVGKGHGMDLGKEGGVAGV